MVLELYPKAIDPQHQDSIKEVVYLHTTIKGIQAGLVISPILAGLHLAYQKLWRKDVLLKHHSYFKWTPQTMLIFALISNGLAYSRLKKGPEFKNKSRAFLIIRNKSQNRADNWTIGGGVLGGVLGASRGMGGGKVGCLGALMGLIGAGIWTNLIKREVL